MASDDLRDISTSLYLLLPTTSTTYKTRFIHKMDKINLQQEPTITHTCPLDNQENFTPSSFQIKLIDKKYLDRLSHRST